MPMATKLPKHADEDGFGQEGIPLRRHTDEEDGFGQDGVPLRRQELTRIPWCTSCLQPCTCFCLKQAPGIKLLKRQHLCDIVLIRNWEVVDFPLQFSWWDGNVFIYFFFPALMYTRCSPHSYAVVPKNQHMMKTKVNTFWVVEFHIELLQCIHWYVCCASLMCFWTCVKNHQKIANNICFLRSFAYYVRANKLQQCMPKNLRIEPLGFTCLSGDPVSS